MRWNFLYFIAFVFSCALSALLTYVARAIGPRLGVIDHPSGRKAHAKPTPVNGGWAVFASFAILAGAGGWIAPALADNLPEDWAPLPHYLRNIVGMRRELAAILLGAGWIFCVGAVDDIRPLGPLTKLFAQIAAVLPLLYVGISIHLFLPSPVFGWIATIIWTVTLMNSSNFLDNMDGLLATIAAVIAAVLAVAAAQGGQLLLPGLFLCFSGVMAGFLIFNFNPASIFIGDSGSLPVGYLLAVFSILTTFYESGQPSGLPVLIPLAVMGVPLFDTISVMLIRWRKGAPLMVGDHNHFSHRLRAMGFSVRQTVITIGILTGAIGLLALPLRYLRWPSAIIHLLAIALLFCVIGALEFAGQQRGQSNEKQ